MKIAACCMTKNEEKDIVEWALYHAWIGFDSILIFDNGSEDRTAESIKSIQKIIDVRLFDWPLPYIPGHAKAFEKAAEECRNEFDWIGLFDHDEFFVPMAHSDAKSYLETMDHHASIAVNWAIYGSSGHVDFPPGLVTESFIRRAPTNFSANHHVKSFLRPTEMIGCVNSHNMDMKAGIETVDVCGNPVQWQKRGKMTKVIGVEDVARFHHYFVRSEAHWAKRMAMPFNAARRDHSQFERNDRNEILDPIIVEKYGAVLERIRTVQQDLAL